VILVAVQQVWIRERMVAAGLGFVPVTFWCKTGGGWERGVVTIFNCILLINFVLFCSVPVNVSTALHVGSDHKGVLLKCSNLPEAPKAPPARPLPHRAFELKSVKEYNKTVLADYLKNHLT